MTDRSLATLSRYVDRAIGFARARLLLRGASLGRRVWVGGDLRFDGRGEVSIGDLVNLVGGIVPTSIRCAPGARLEIGEGCIFNYGVTLDARASIRVGRRCSLGSLVSVVDEGREGARPIVIGDDVWIAHGAVIEPGVTIGEGAVVSAGSVVVADVPPRTLAIGNPARTMSLKLVSAETR